MCAINGLYAYNSAAGAPDRRELIAVRDAMKTRGPDGAGEWWSEERRVGFGHRRLSIIDLSNRASQPMRSSDGRLVVTFNGEIYNHPTLRTELERQGRVFRTASDTETLLHLYELYGPDMVNRLRGMFAFAIWDTEKRGVLLARDPYGIKPLYTSNDGWTLRFASQVKALLAGGRISREPEPAGIVGFHVWGSVPEPFTLYRDIRALPAGHTQWIDAAGAREPRCYARVAAVITEGALKPAPAGELNALVRRAARDSVGAHLLADVEVGLFLSAGVDSGALLGLMRDAGQSKIRAITLGFEEFRDTIDDETPIAAQVARAYGAEHIVRRVSAAEFKRDLPHVIESMDQPSIDGVNTWYVSKTASEAGLKVALSGLGGDELLAGYPSFRDVPKWARWLSVPSAVPGAGAVARQIAAITGINRGNPKASGMIEYGGTFSGAYLLRRALFLPFELQSILEPDLVRAGLHRLRPLNRVREEALTPDPKHPCARVAALEACCYMRNQLLRDSDWAGMAHGLEIRTPLVDWHMLRAISPLMPALGADPKAGKNALAAAPNLAVPHAVVARPKTGFGVPTAHWLSTGPGPQNKGAASRAWAREVFECFQTISGTQDKAA